MSISFTPIIIAGIHTNTPSRHRNAVREKSRPLTEHVEDQDSESGGVS
jgi:hypothetical protein